MSLPLSGQESCILLPSYGGGLGGKNTRLGGKGERLAAGGIRQGKVLLGLPTCPSLLNGLPSNRPSGEGKLNEHDSPRQARRRHCRNPPRPRPVDGSRRRCRNTRLACSAGRGKPCTAAGYFTDLDKAVQAAAALDKRKAAGVYLVLNEINPALLARSPNQTTDYPDPTTSDGDITRRRWLPLDFDPTRPAGISSTEDEHCTAEDVARQCAAWLYSLGWPAPILADSGNGAHLLYRIDLPNDEARRHLSASNGDRCPAIQRAGC